MAYKVEFKTFAIVGDNKIGNICQSVETIYTDRDIHELKGLIDADLESRNKVCEITSVIRVDGKCL